MEQTAASMTVRTLMETIGFALSVISLAICLSCSRGVTENRSVGGMGVNASGTQSAQKDTLVALTNRLSSDDESDRVEAEATLIDIANSSADSRHEVIDRLVQSTDRTELSQEILHSRKMFLLWTSVAEICGTIKAEEALDLLIGCLDCNSGEASSSARAYPALRAVIRIGPPAVPKLSTALLSSPDPRTREFAARGLSSIGGKDAKAALEKALIAEKDQSVAANIRLSLAAIARAEKTK